MHRARLWLGAAASAAGVVAGWKQPPLLPIVCLGIAGLGAMVVRGSARRLAGLCVVAFVLGVVVVAAHVSRAAPIGDAARGYPRCRVSGTVSQRTSFGTFVRLSSAICGRRPLPGGAEVVVGDAVGELGGRVAAVGWLTPLDDGGIDGARRRAGAAAAFDAASLRVGPPRSVLYRAALAIRRSLRAATSDRAPTTAGLLRGLATGETDRLPKRSEESLRRAGLSHLVAVSGTNVTIVLTVVAALVGRISRRARLVSCAAALTLFVAVVGPEPSVLRAAAMGAIGLAAMGAGSRSSPLDALAIAIICLLALRPQMVHSIGSHLSVVATAGICLWGSRLETRFRSGPRWLRTATAVTISAQVAVAPLLIITFGEISTTGVPANVLAAPAVAPATVISLLAAIVGLLWADGARSLIGVAAPFADWIARVGSALGGHQGSSMQVDPALGIFAGIAIVAIAIRRARAAPLHPPGRARPRRADMVH